VESDTEHKSTNSSEATVFLTDHFVLVQQCSAPETRQRTRNKNNNNNDRSNNRKNNGSNRSNNSDSNNENRSASGDEEDEEFEEIDKELQRIIDGISKTNNYKEKVTATDTEIMTVIMRKIIIPQMILRRKMAADREEMSTIQSNSNSENEASDSEPSSSFSPSRNSSFAPSRNSSFSSSSSSISSFSSPSSSSFFSTRRVDLSRCPFPLLLFLDGDYPQITALGNVLLIDFEDAYQRIEMPWWYQWNKPTK
jgi:hypothetical protein